MGWITRKEKYDCGCIYSYEIYDSNLTYGWRDGEIGNETWIYCELHKNISEKILCCGCIVYSQYRNQKNIERCEYHHKLHEKHKKEYENIGDPPPRPSEGASYTEWEEWEMFTTKQMIKTFLDNM